MWVVADARRRLAMLPYDFGSFDFFLGWVVLPGYLIASRGWKGFLTLGWIIFLWAAPFVSALLLLGGGSPVSPR